jgi:hypothetical protein
VTRPTATGQERRWLAARLTRVPWLLVSVLALQAALSLRLTWSNTAFQDEALYLWAGHLEWAHWLRGTHILAFPAYFSGAPVIYPALGSLADSVGGLAAARVLSLGFMLGATSLLWAVVSRLYGRRAAFFVVALWVTIGPVLKLGAFATFDAMSLCLLALSAYLVVRARPRPEDSGWMIWAAAAMVLANATAYSSAIFDPVIIALAYLTASGAAGREVGRGRAIQLGVCAVAAVTGLLALGGSSYVHGIMGTVLARPAGTDSPLLVARDALHWSGVIPELAVAGALICLVQRRHRLLSVVLAGAAFLVPLAQARVHTATSLDKHVAIGLWFAAIIAGYLVDQSLSFLRWRAARFGVAFACIAALAVPAVAGWHAAQALFSNWADSASFVTAFRPVADSTSGPLLVETPTVAEYYLSAGHEWRRWSSTFAVTLPDGRAEIPGVGRTPSASAYGPLIARGYFEVIALHGGGFSRGTDAAIISKLRQNPAYHLMARLPYGPGQYTVWENKQYTGRPLPVTASGTDAGHDLRGLLFPVIRPVHYLTIAGLCFLWSGIVAVIIAVAVRTVWRRGKGLEDL